MDDASNDPRVGTVLGERYRILERLAVGSMGVVYRAERIQLGRALAVKFLHASYASDPQFIQRFERETRVMSRLGHPHCVSVIDFGVEDAPYVVMEYVSGRTLRTLLDQGRLEIDRSIHITRQVLAGLAHAHAQGIVHRDIKPANIMLTEATGTGDHVRILDFGLATLRDAHSADLSQSAIVVGTPNYMSPEQSMGGKVDARSDVYSTGVVLFELLTGHKPFTADDTFELLNKHRTAPVPKLREVVPEVGFSPGLQHVIERALAKQPADRYPSAIEFAVALDAAVPLRLQTVAEGETAAGAGAANPVPAPIALAETQALASEVPAHRRGPGFLTVLVALALLTGAAWAGYSAWRSRQHRGAGHRQAAAGATGATAARDPAGGAGAGAAGAAPDSPDSPDHDLAATADLGGDAGAPLADNAVMGPLTLVGGDAGPDSAALGDGGPAAAIAVQGVTGDGGPVAAGVAAGVAADASAALAGTLPGTGDAGADQDDDDEPPDPPLPPDERDEPVAPVPDSENDVNSAEPKTPAAAEVERHVTAPPANPVNTIPEAVALIRAGKREQAIRALLMLKRKMPRSAYVPYLLGNLYFEKRWWTVGMDYYRAAIRNNHLYRGKRILNHNVIRALGDGRTRRTAVRLFLNVTKRASLPYLRHAAKHDPNRKVRAQAAWLSRRLTPHRHHIRRRNFRH